MKNYIIRNKGYYFITNEKGYGHWKYIKQRIKTILDSPQISKYEKILTIQGLLEDYYLRYIKKED